MKKEKTERDTKIQRKKVRTRVRVGVSVSFPILCTPYHHSNPNPNPNPNPFFKPLRNLPSGPVLSVLLKTFLEHVPVNRVERGSQRGKREFP
jgi:hypothetical protein